MNLRYVAGYAWFAGVHSVKENYPYLIAHLALPLSLIFIVGVLSHGALLPFALAGGTVMAIASDGAGTAQELTYLRLEYMYQDFIVATKTGPIDYMLGEIFAGLPWVTPSIILYFALDAVYGMLTLYNLVMTLIVSVLLVVSVSSLAFLLSSRMKHARLIGPYSLIFSYAMTVLPPTFYPFNYLPRWIVTALAVFPTTPAAVLEQGFFGLEPTAWYMLGILALEALVYFAMARSFTRWREK